MISKFHSALKRKILSAMNRLIKTSNIINLINLQFSARKNRTSLGVELPSCCCPRKGKRKFLSGSTQGKKYQEEELFLRLAVWPGFPIWKSTRFLLLITAVSHAEPKRWKGEVDWELVAFIYENLGEFGNGMITPSHPLGCRMLFVYFSLFYPGIQTDNVPIVSPFAK